MFEIDTDKTISITRGDSGSFVAPIDYALQSGDVLRLKVFRKKACEDVVRQIDFPLDKSKGNVEIDGTTITFFLTEDETRIGGVISKPVDYWYEIELNPDNNPKTLVGYDEDGAKIFKLYPEGRDMEDDELTEEEKDTLTKLFEEFKEEETKVINKQLDDFREEFEQNGGGSSGGSFVQTDYLQNDPTASDYIKNRPFYSETKTEINRDIIPLQEVEFISVDCGVEGYLCGLIEYSDISVLEIVEKGQYNLTIDDTTYPITMTDIEGYLSFGNLSIVGLSDYDSGEAFYGAIGTDNCFHILLKTAETNHTIGLSHIGDYAPIITEGVYSFADMEGMCGMAQWDDDWGFTHEDGEKYNLTINDVLYKNLELIQNDIVGYVAGNLALAGLGDNTGEDYLVAFGGYGITICTPTAGDYTISLEKSLLKTTETIYKIDSKYLDIDVDVPYTVDDEDNVIFENDIVIDGEMSVRESIDSVKNDVTTLQNGISGIEESVTEAQKAVENLPNFTKGVAFYSSSSGFLSSDSISTNSTIPVGLSAWVEGNGGSNIYYETNGDCQLSVTTTTSGKTSTTESKIIIESSGDANVKTELEKCNYFGVSFADESNKIYYIARNYISTVAADGDDVVLDFYFYFINNEDSFSITDADNGRELKNFVGYKNLGRYSHSENSSTAFGENAHAQGVNTLARGAGSNAQGADTIADGDYSNAEGCGTIAGSMFQHVEGEYNIVDTEDKYAHIVGNGTDDDNRSNAHTLDWHGNSWYSGSVETPIVKTDTVKTRVWEGAILTSLVEESSFPSGWSGASILLGSNLLEAEQWYLVTINNGENKSYKLKPVINITYDDRIEYLLGDEDEHKFCIIQQSNGVVYLDVDLSLVDVVEAETATYRLDRYDLPKMDLATYIDTLRERIEVLEAKLAATTE
jgi:hypothetical protein